MAAVLTAEMALISIEVGKTRISVSSAILPSNRVAEIIWKCLVSPLDKLSISGPQFHKINLLMYSNVEFGAC